MIEKRAITISKRSIVLSLVAVSISVYALWSNRKPTIYSVDLGKITAAQMLIVGRAKANGLNKTYWMQTITKANKKTKAVIKSIAKDNLVVVSPAVLSGTVDITNKVLRKLSLPTDVPNINIAKNKIFGDDLSITKQDQLNAKAQVEKEARRSKTDANSWWMKP